MWDASSKLIVPHLSRPTLLLSSVSGDSSRRHGALHSRENRRLIDRVLHQRERPGIALARAIHGNQLANVRRTHERRTTIVPGERVVIQLEGTVARLPPG